jgi:hemerythrin
MLTWSSQYETGVTLVDTQHKVLFDNINKLETFTRLQQIPKGELDRLVQFLEGYVVSHFKFEETCMQRFHCTTHEENKRAHAQFLEAFGKLKAEYQVQGPTHAFVTKLYSVASNWITGHILKVDIKLKAVAKSATVVQN